MNNYLGKKHYKEVAIIKWLFRTYLGKMTRIKIVKPKTIAIGIHN